MTAIITLEKVCSICSTSKPLSEFSGKRCRSCRSTLERERLQNDPVRAQKRRNAVRAWHENNPKESFTRYRSAHLKSEYGLTTAEYEAMLKSQNNCCAICKQEETWTYKNGRVASLSVDHDHKTGKIRGLLCRDCNQSLGKFKDDYALVYAAYQYLSIHKMEENI
jgi:hypothetical protein